MRHRLWLLRMTRLGMCALLAGSAGGCIQVRAPDKPIEINLNVKIQQEVVVRLQQDAKDLEALLDEAATAVQDARQLAVDGQYDDRGVLDALDRAGDRLARAQSRW